MIFYDINRPINQIAYTIINGARHMWFLPMLFWCFVGVYLVEKIKIKPFIILIIGIFIAIIPIPELPLRINMALKYFIFFYIGFGIQKRYFKFLSPNNKIKPILLCIVVYLSMFILYYVIIGENYSFTHSDNYLIKKIVRITLNHTLSLIMSLSGLLGVFWSAHYFIK